MLRLAKSIKIYLKCAPVCSKTRSVPSTFLYKEQCLQYVIRKMYEMNVFAIKISDFIYHANNVN